jgi:leucyl-tRNA synthetase
MQYDFRAIENKWQQHWKENNTYKVSNTSNKPKCYVLDMFPYPSGSGLHVGHPLGYIASDIYARYKRLKGYNVLHPMGFDAFGLPAEQYAIETGQHPADTTKVNIKRYKEQLEKIGFCYDWEREIITAEPSYYKWTQWIFSKLFESYFDTTTNKAQPIATLQKQFETEGCTADEHTFSANEWNNYTKGKQEEILMQFRLAYRAESQVNWCEALGTVLANDEVINGVSERGGHPVERKLMSQWFLRISAYAERLLNALDNLEYPDSLKEMQRNWIGKSVGATINFKLEQQEGTIEVFTTRPDTIFGTSFLVLAPEHELVAKITRAEQQETIKNYITKTAKRSERERLSETKTVSGAFTGAYAVHPFSKEKLPIWIADYVLINYGTGAIMAVPAGDDRDYKFAQEYKLSIPAIFKNYDIKEGACTDKNATLQHSDFLNEKNYEQAAPLAIKKLQEENAGQEKINYRMRDAGFSRQRYWGEPFPILTNDNGQYKLAKELPVALPIVDKYENGPEGKGPLANLNEWIQVGDWTRETDTMPGYAGSSWYYLRYMDPANDEAFCSKDASDYWNQVDVYVGGAEHAVGHLLYSRLWCKVLHDLGYISFDEPYKKVLNQGMIQGNSRLVYRIVGENTFVSANLKSNYETEPLHVDVSMCDGLELNTNSFKNWRNDFNTAQFILEDGKYICGQQTEKMSKRLYNVVNPDDIVNDYGADTFRMYEMFLGPIEDSKPWDTKGIEGVHRFLKKLWRLFYNEEKLIITEEAPSKDELKTLHQTIQKVQQGTETFSFNTAVSQFMICVNELGKLNCSKKEILTPLLSMLSSYAPHITEELWQCLGYNTSVLDSSYPILIEEYLKEDEINYPIAFNGKVKFQMTFDAEATPQSIEEAVRSNEKTLAQVGDKSIKKVIVVKGRMINIVI